MSVKRKYCISGFDCPSCASKSEAHLNKQKEIESASIDFQNERLYVTYVDKELSINQIKQIIKEVESDPVEITKLEDKTNKKESIFDSEFYFNLSRIIFSISAAIITKIFVNYQDNFLLAIILYSLATLVCLYDVLFKVFRNIVNKVNPVDINLLMSISSIGVIVLGSLIHYGVLPEGPFEIDLLDGVLVVALYQVGEMFEHIASNKSKKAIKSAIDLRADKANLVDGDCIKQVEPEQLEVGNKILINVGELIPVDGVVIDGEGSLDVSSLTGESLPVNVSIKENVLSGSILKSGSIIIEVKKRFADSTMSKIMELVESSGERKAKAEKFITKFARVYTPLVFVIGLAYALIFGFVSGVWSKAIFGGLAILVVSCPCAIVISVPLAYFAGIGLASKHGIIIKGSNYLDSLCNIGTLFIDKTGTLTYGNFKVSEIHASNKEEFLDALYAAESRSNHPLAKAVIYDVDTSKYLNKISKYEEFAGEGVLAIYNKDEIIAGTKAFLNKKSVDCEDFDGVGSAIHVAKNGKYLGYAVLKDEIREDAKETVKKLLDIGVKVVLLSGDKELSVKEVAKQVLIEEYHHGLLPADKTKFVEEAVENRTNKLVAFAGDGINDTPSIIRADVGFAMGGVGSDAAIENADVVLMEDHPKKIYDSIRIAKKTRRVALFNIVFSLLVKATVIVLILTGVLGQYGMIIAVLADTGLSALMIFHSLLLIYTKVK